MPRAKTKAAPAKDKEKRGIALARAIEHRASCLGLSQKESAKELGFSEPYYALLLSGQRWFGSVSEDKLKRIASFLDVPLVSVYLLGEILHPEDFFRTSSLEDRLELVFRHLSQDPYLAGVAPNRKDWDRTPLPIRLLCATLYERLSDKELLERAKLMDIVPGQ